MKTKVCKQCKRCCLVKPRSDFHVGRARECKACTRLSSFEKRARKAGIESTKQCGLCHKEKSKLEFESHRSTGWGANCKACLADLYRAGRKHCNLCSEIKPVSEFHIRRKSKKDGLCMTCKECAKRRVSGWRDANPGAFKEWYAANRERRADYWREWYVANVEARAKYWIEWSTANPGIVGIIGARRRKALVQAIPAWADMDAIREMYVESARLSKETGIPREAATSSRNGSAWVDL